MHNGLEAFIVRLPNELHVKIKSTAKSERRSMNQEIIERLERSFSSLHRSAPDSIIEKLLYDRIVLLESQIGEILTELRIRT